MAHKPNYYNLEIKYLGRCPRTFPTPIPFVSKSAQTGSVECNPTGVFSYEDGQYLLSLDPTMFELVREISPILPPNEEKEAEASAPEREIKRRKRKRKYTRHAVTEESEGQSEPSLVTAG